MIINNPKPLPKLTDDLQLSTLYKDLQANILKGNGRKHARFLFVQFKGPSNEVKTWITGKVVGQLTPFWRSNVRGSKRRSERDPIDPGMKTFSISKKGYDFLGVTSAFGDASFNKGMGSGTITHDPPKNKWEPKYQNDIHALFIIATDDDDIEVRVAEVTSTFGNIVTLIGQEQGDALKGEREPFGFLDGVSQPRFFDEDLKKELDNQETGKKKFNNWNPFAPLNLALVKDPLGKAFKGNDNPVMEGGSYSYGSYLVFRKLEQNVDGWNAEVVKVSGQLGVSPDLFAAFAVGRFQNGTPVINHGEPTSDISSFENDFNFKSDPEGLKCPYHAHIRKANPRGDSIKFVKEQRNRKITLEDEKKHRIVRRGIPYTDGEKVGLLFLCYQSSIIDQFEFMQNNWIDLVDFAEGKPAPNQTGDDSVISDANAVNAQPVIKRWPTEHGGPNTKSLDFKHFVTLRGGEYFFTPSISSLKAMRALVNAV